MTLKDLLEQGRLYRQPPNRREIARLLAVADRDLADANVGELSLDRRFATAYSAALQLTTVVLRASGFRTSSASAGHHATTLSVLAELMGSVQSDRATYLDACRRTRNQADYDRIDVVSEADLLELLEDTLAFREEVREWLGRTHPGLV